MSELIKTVHEYPWTSFFIACFIYGILDLLLKTIYNMIVASKKS